MTMDFVSKAKVQAFQAVQVSTKSQLGRLRPPTPPTQPPTRAEDVNDVVLVRAAGGGAAVVDAPAAAHAVAQGVAVLALQARQHLREGGARAAAVEDAASAGRAAGGGGWVRRHTSRHAGHGGLLAHLQWSGRHTLDLRYARWFAGLLDSIHAGNKLAISSLTSPRPEIKCKQA